MAGGFLVHQSGIKAAFPALEAQSLNHWTAREVLVLLLNYSINRSIIHIYDLLLILNSMMHACQCSCHCCMVPHCML